MSSEFTVQRHCEIWVRGRCDAAVDCALHDLSGGATVGETDAVSYFRFAGTIEGRMGPRPCAALDFLCVEVPTLSQHVLLPQTLVGAFSPRAQAQLERAGTAAYAVALAPQDAERARCSEGQDRGGRSLSLTGLFTVAADLQRALAAGRCAQLAEGGFALHRLPRAARGRRERERRCRVAKRPRRGGQLHCGTPQAALGAATPTPTAAVPAPAREKRPELCDLAEGPFMLVAACADREALCCLDQTCRALRAANRTPGGAWQRLGSETFRALELWREGAFAPQAPRGERPEDWKQRYSRFARGVVAFRAPFGGSEICAVERPDECAQLQCALRGDILGCASSRGLYLELEVLSNPDHVTLALVDWEAGGSSSVTFSPTTGTVFRERILGEAPKQIRGEYVQRLPAAAPGLRFEGPMGLYVQGGRIAFFRRWACGDVDGTGAEPCWESTGFVTGLSWAQGCQLTPCLAFCKAGAYRVRVVGLATAPPMPSHEVPPMCDEAAWRRFDWE